MAVVGEAILTAVFENLFDKLTSPGLLEFANREKIRDDLNKWEKILQKIHAVLEDAEEKQMKNRSVKLWLSDLNQLAYDVEDILDEFATEDLRIKLVNEPEASTSKLLQDGVESLSILELDNQERKHNQTGAYCHTGFYSNYNTALAVMTHLENVLANTSQVIMMEKC